ncbi:MAG: hypothetical protein J5I52_05885 [Saprospiraceae bacterium]|nr:hypothetical protein [Saprospiraceae bacterium]MCZ2338763.1 hypothetical protein [Chitinophagales bacterium]
MKLSFNIKTFFWIAFVAVILISNGCSSSKKSLERGDYYKATMQAVEHLRTSPGSKKSKEVLLKAYPLAKSASLRKIQEAIELKSLNKYSITADEYIALNTMADAIFHCPKALELIPTPQKYNKELGEVLPKAAEESYNLGLDQLKQHTIYSAREAYYLFVKANDYVPGYKDVNKMIEDALYEATLKVCVQKPMTPGQYQLTADFFYNNLMSKIAGVTRDKFIRFYTYEEAKNEGLKSPDQILLLNFEDFSVGNMVESKNTYEVTKDSVLVGTTTINDKKQDVYGTVKAKFTNYKREVISQGILSVQIMDANNNRVLEHNSFPGKYVWVNEWASFNGDERALNDDQKKKVNSVSLMPPPHQDLFIQFTKPIFDQTVSFVNRFYTKP